jgi:hypothetical protein
MVMGKSAAAEAREALKSKKGKRAARRAQAPPARKPAGDPALSGGFTLQGNVLAAQGGRLGFISI